MSTYSPGPWWWRGEHHRGLFDAEGKQVAFTGINARLIAAAPELLLLLRDLVESFPALPLVHERELIARIDGKVKP